MSTRTGGKRKASSRPLSGVPALDENAQSIARAYERMQQAETEVATAQRALGDTFVRGFASATNEWDRAHSWDRTSRYHTEAEQSARYREIRAAVSETPDAKAAAQRLNAARSAADIAHRQHFEALDAHRPRLADSQLTDVRIERGALSAQEADLLNGMSTADLATVAGARSGDTVYVSPSTQHDTPYVRITLKPVGGNRVFEAGIQRSEKTWRRVLVNSTVRNDEARTATSGRELVRHLIGYRRAGIDEIHATAYRNDSKDWNGYYTWARLGFQGDIPRDTIEKAQARFGSSVSQVQDVMSRPGGAAWWKRYGDTYSARLDLHDPRTTAILGRLGRNTA